MKERLRQGWIREGSQTASCAQAIAAVFDQAERRDPGHARPWIALADGDQHQIEADGDQHQIEAGGDQHQIEAGGDQHQIEVICAEAAARGVTIRIVADLIHVLAAGQGPCCGREWHRWAARMPPGCDIAPAAGLPRDAIPLYPIMRRS